MKLDFAGAIKKALDKSTVDEQVATDVDALVKRIAAGTPKDATPVAPLPEQLEVVTRQAIREHGLMAVIEQAIVDEVVNASKPPAAAAPMGASAK